MCLRPSVRNPFDTVPHVRLILKIERLGVFGDTVRLLRSYLTGRRETYRYGDDTSGEESVRMGVPQGSNFGPLLFVAFINDLLDLPMDGTVISFADDAAIVLRHENIDVLAEKASVCSSLLYRWISINGLVLNSSKTRFLLFSKCSGTISFRMHHPACSTVGFCLRVRIMNTTHHKFLGLYLDADLKFQHHVYHICRKLRSGIAVLDRMRNTCTKAVKMAAYHASIASHIHYMLPNYGGAPATSRAVLV